jgi:NodT family efflux transporter outer membrane factor (OMF) lipoprotein
MYGPFHIFCKWNLRVRFESLFLLTSLGLLSACAVGPDYHRPGVPDAVTYDFEPLPDKVEAPNAENGKAQVFAPGKDIPADWWTLFHSESLNQLITQAIKGNPDLAAAQASLRAAEENTEAGGGLLFPTVSGSFTNSRQKISGANNGGQFPGTIYSLHNASVSVSYGLDLFGGTRRAIEELEAQEDAQRFQLQATYISLTANVVTAAVQEASLRGQIAATRAIVGEEEKELKVLKDQFEAGAVARTGVLAQTAQLAQAKAALPPLEQQLSQVRHQLSALMGQLPSDDPAVKFDLTSIKLPEELPVSLPSKLVEQRPDIRAAEANLHAASAAIGVAEANRLPQITLTGDVGNVANTFAGMFGPGTEFWNLGAGLTQTIFDAGTLEHKQHAAEAEYDAAAAQYRKTVIAAFQDVADTLRALQSDAATLEARAASEHAAADSLKLTREQYKVGAINYIELLNAEQTEQQARLALVAAEAQRFADSAALFQALGGGWWNQNIELKTVDTTTTQNETQNSAPQTLQSWRHE